MHDVPDNTSRGVCRLTWLRDKTWKCTLCPVKKKEHYFVNKFPACRVKERLLVIISWLVLHSLFHPGQGRSFCLANSAASHLKSRSLTKWWQQSCLISHKYSRPQQIHEWKKDEMIKLTACWQNLQLGFGFWPISCHETAILTFEKKLWHD